MVTPDYRGANEYSTYAVPIPYLTYRGERLKVTRDRVRGLIFNTDRLELDVSGNFTVPVRASRNEARRGMDNLDPVWELGPSLKVTLYADERRTRDFALRLPVRAAVASNLTRVHGAGFTFTPNLGMDWRELTIGSTGGWNTSIYGTLLFGLLLLMAVCARPRVAVSRLKKLLLPAVGPASAVTHNLPSFIVHFPADLVPSARITSIVPPSL